MPASSRARIFHESPLKKVSISNTFHAVRVPKLRFKDFLSFFYVKNNQKGCGGAEKLKTSR